MRTQQAHRMHDVGGAQAERAAFLRRQGLGQDEVAVQRVGEAQARRHPERQAQVDATENAAHRRAHDESQSEGRAQHAEFRGALRGWRDVGDVGAGRGVAGRSDAGDEAADEQPAQRGRHGHQDVVETEAEIRREDHRAPAEMVRGGADDGREDELHGGPQRAEQSHVPGRAGHVAVLEMDDQLRQHRHDDSHRHHVEGDGDEHEDERRRPRGARPCDFHLLSDRARSGQFRRVWPSRPRETACCRAR